MQNIISNEKKKAISSICRCSGILVLLFFGINFSIEYATDSYATFMDHSVWKYMLFENGRIINAAIYWLFYQCSFSPKAVYLISYLSAILFSFLSVSIYSFILTCCIDNKYYATFLSFSILMNPFSIEYFLYIEKGLFMFSLFCIVCAIYFIQKYFSCRNKSQLCITLLFLLVSVLCYQITVGMFVICSLPLLVKEYQTKKTFLYNNIIIALLYGGSLGCSYLITSVLLHSSRVKSVNSITYTLNNTFENIITITKDSYYHLPNNYLLAWYCISFLTILFLFFQNTKKLLFILTLLYGFGATVLVAFFPFLCGVTTDFSCRTVYPYGSIWGILLILALQFKSSCGNNAMQNTCFKDSNKSEINYNFKSMFKRFIILLFLCLLFVQYLLFQQVFLDRYKSNQTDKYICQMIGERIRDYEKAGNTITTICFYKDQSLTWGIDGAFQNGLLDRAHAVGWSNLASINYYLDKQYIKGESQEKYINYFQSKDWNFYSDEQLIFDNDTLHFCVY